MLKRNRVDGACGGIRETTEVECVMNCLFRGELLKRVSSCVDVRAGLGSYTVELHHNQFHLCNNTRTNELLKHSRAKIKIHLLLKSLVYLLGSSKDGPCLHSSVILMVCGGGMFSQVNGLVRFLVM